MSTDIKSINQDKQSDVVPEEENKKKKLVVKAKDLSINKIFLMLIVRVMFYLINIAFLYVIKPLCLLFEYAFLLHFSRLDTTIDETISTETAIKDIEGVYLIGYVILFVFPIIRFFIYGLKIVLVQRRWYGKIWTFLIVLLESFFYFPLTFLLNDNNYSMFLFMEDEFGKLLSPWLIFYPTNFTLSTINLLMLLAENVFFLIAGLAKYNSKTDVTKDSFTLAIILLVIFNILSLIAFAVLAIVKIDSLVRTYCVTKDVGEKEEKKDKEESVDAIEKDEATKEKSGQVKESEHNQI